MINKNQIYRNRIELILKNAKILSEGLIKKCIIIIQNGIIKTLNFEDNQDLLFSHTEKNEDEIVLDCENKIVLPGIIDIHAHLRDLGQSEKETFNTGTKAAAFSGITTIFNMPNTKPPAISANQVRDWIQKAENNIHVNVGFISGVPKQIDFNEIMEIVELGVIGFKIYPLNSLNNIDWVDSLKIQKLLDISSKLQIPIFIHPDMPLSEDEKTEIFEQFENQEIEILKLHNNLYPPRTEALYVNFILENYYKLISDKKLNSEEYPIVHFCHISCKDSYSLVKNAIDKYKDLKITFEVTPHHLILSNDINLKNPNYGKVLPPLREEIHSQYLFNELKKGNIKLIGTDHAPHTVKEKEEDYSKAPSGFPGFETYPLVILDKICNYELSLETFVKISSENPAKIFNLKNKGFIKEGYDADLIIIDKIPEYPINPNKFKTKAKYSPFKNYLSNIQIWKVFLKGIEVNREDSKPKGQVIKRSE